MAQFGAATVITPQVRLIILDCFETLVELEGGAYRPRRGVHEFLAHFHGRPNTTLVVASDAEEHLVLATLAQAGILGRFAALYHAGNAMEDLGDGRVRKRLDVPLAAHGVGPEEAVFIGDSPLDAEAARHHRLPFIRVPRSEDRAFSFTTLIGGPSRYNSAEFSAAFLEQYLRDHPKRPGGG